MLGEILFVTVNRDLFFSLKGFISLTQLCLMLAPPDVSKCEKLFGVTLFPDDTPVATAKRLPGESEEERDSSGRLWRTVIIGDQEQRIDMQVIRPYLRVVTHGG